MARMAAKPRRTMANGEARLEALPGTLVVGMTEGVVLLAVLVAGEEVLAISESVRVIEGRTNRSWMQKRSFRCRC